MLPARSAKDAPGLLELQALEWLTYEGTTGVGVKWSIRAPPRTLSKAAIGYYKYQIDKRRWRLDLKRLRLDALELKADRKALLERIDAIESMLEQSEQPETATVESEIGSITAAIHSGSKAR